MHLQLSLVFSDVDCKTEENDSSQVLVSSYSLVLIALKFFLNSEFKSRVSEFNPRDKWSEIDFSHIDLMKLHVISYDKKL